MASKRLSKNMYTVVSPGYDLLDRTKPMLGKARQKVQESGLWSI